MGDIIACLVGMPDMKLREEIAEMLRAHQIRTTENIQQATVIIHIPDKAPQMTIEELSLQLIEQTQAKVFRLLSEHFDLSDVPVVLPSPVISKDKHKTFNSKHTIKQYNNTKQNQKRIIFNRTKCK